MTVRSVTARMIAEGAQFIRELHSMGRAVDRVDDKVDKLNRKRINVKGTVETRETSPGRESTPGGGRGVSAGRINNLQAKLLVGASPLLAPTGGLLLGIPAAATAAIGPLTAVGIAVNGVGDAFKAAAQGDVEKFGEAMTKLAPQARAFVYEIQGIQPQFTRLHRITQNQLFGPMIGDLELLTRSYLPSLNKSLPLIADSVGRAGNRFTMWATAPATVAAVDRQVRGAVESVDIFGNTLIDAADLMVRLGDTGSDFSHDFLTTIGRMISGLRGWVAEGQRTGQLKEIFDATGVSLDELVSTLGTLGKILADVLVNPGTIQAVTNMITAINGLLKVISVFTGVFSSLPSGVQTFIATLGLAAFAVSRLDRTFESLGRRSKQVQASLWNKDLDRTAKGLGGVAAFGGRALGVLAGLQIASSILSTQMDKAALSADAMQKSVSSFAKGGSSLKTFGKDIDDIFASMKQGGTDGFFNGLARLVEDTVPYIQTFDWSLASSDRAVQSFDQGLAALVQGGNFEEARAAFSRFSMDGQQAGLSTEEITKKLPAYASAMAMVPTAANLAAEGLRKQALSADLLAGSMQDAISSGRTFIEVWNQLNGAALNSDKAMAAALEAVNKVKEGFQENGKAIQGNTLAAIQNRINVREAGLAAATAAQAVYDQKVATEGVTAAQIAAQATYQASIGPLQALMTRLFGAKEGARLLKDVLGIMPKFIPIKVTDNLDSENDRFTSFGARLRALSGRHFGVYLDVITRGSGDPLPPGATTSKPKNFKQLLSPFKDGGPIIGLAEGGFSGYINGRGTARSDSNLIYGSNGEFMMKASSVDSVGANTMSYINETGKLPNQPIVIPPAQIAPVIKVFVGNTEITEIVRTEVTTNDRRQTQLATNGRR